jgi:hypothetical protein
MSCILGRIKKAFIDYF